MATQTESNNHGGLYFIVGILVVGLGILAYFMFAGNGAGPAPANSAVERSADAVGDAADKVGDTAKGATGG
jgi:uncharacterized membrane protein YqiK